MGGPEHCFYVAELAEGVVSLDAGESTHCSRVLRLTEGDQIGLTDGKGRTAKGAISRVKGGCVEVTVARVEAHARSRGERGAICLALPKNEDRLEWFVEKATELGLGRVVLLSCARQVRKRANVERLRRVIVAALKQSHGAYMPELVGPLRVEELGTLEWSPEGVRAIAHCNSGCARLSLRELATASAGPLEVLIGPEGDFTEEEVRTARDMGFRAVTLGAKRLRVETAALLVAALGAE